MAITHFQAVPAAGWFARIGVKYGKVLFWEVALDIEDPTIIHRKGVVWNPSAREYSHAEDFPGFLGYHYSPLASRGKKLNYDRIRDWLEAQGSKFSATDVQRWGNTQLKEFIQELLGSQMAEELGIVEDEEIG